MKFSTVYSYNSGPSWSLDPRCKHLNHGSFGAVPVEVQAEQNRLRTLMEKNPVSWFSAAHERVSRAREEMARHLSVDPSHLAFVFNVSAGASVVYQRFMAQGSVHTLVTDHGYGAVSMGARRLSQRTGGTFNVVSVPLNATAAEVVDILTEKMQHIPPGLLVIDQVTSATARRFPANEICKKARELGFTTLVDGAHSPGVLENPICFDADYWVGNLHKFACAPRGAALLYSRDADQELFPLIDSWGAELEFPKRFDHTGTMDTTAWLTAPFAWNLIDETVGWDKVRQWSSHLADEGEKILDVTLRQWMDDPFPDVGQKVGPLRLARLPLGLGRTREQSDALRIPFIEATGIALSFTSFHGQGFLRFSTHIYNSLSDFDYLASEGLPLLHQWASQISTESNIMNNKD